MSVLRLSMNARKNDSAGRAAPQGPAGAPLCEAFRPAGEIDHAHTIDEHRAGSSIRREIAPRECWACEPTVELVLGV